MMFTRWYLTIPTFLLRIWLPNTRLKYSLIQYRPHFMINFQSLEIPTLEEARRSRKNYPRKVFQARLTSTGSSCTRLPTEMVHSATQIRKVVCPRSFSTATSMQTRRTKASKYWTQPRQEYASIHSRWAQDSCARQVAYYQKQLQRLMWHQTWYRQCWA